jgi:hypothetical protein
LVLVETGALTFAVRGGNWIDFAATAVPPFVRCTQAAWLEMLPTTSAKAAAVVIKREVFIEMLRWLECADHRRTSFTKRHPSSTSRD